MDLPKRKPNRLEGYDYSQDGAYFITMCVKEKRELLWNVVGARIARPQDTAHLSNYGIAVDTAIQKITEHYTDVSVDKYVIMPNHIHLIFTLLKDGGRAMRAPTIVTMQEDGGRAMRAPTIATMINQMKGFVTKQIGFSMWQRSYHDHIIRDEREYQMIWKYIDENPLSWEFDCLNENHSGSH